MCFAPGCTSICSSKDLVKRVLFSFPKDEKLCSQWKRAIPRDSSFVTCASKVCDLHFEEDAIIKTKTTIIEGKETVVPRSRWALKEGAIPTKFPSMFSNYHSKITKFYSFMLLLDCPAYLSKRSIKKRKPVERLPYKMVPKKGKKVDDANKVTQPTKSSHIETQSESETPIHLDFISNLPSPVTNSEVPIAVREVTLPGDTWGVICSSNLENSAYIYDVIVLKRAPIIRKCLVIDTQSKELKFKVFNKLCTMEKGFPHNFSSIMDLEVILKRFHSASVCEGIKDEIYHPLQVLEIKSGVFTDGVWSSTK